MRREGLIFVVLVFRNNGLYLRTRSIFFCWRRRQRTIPADIFSRRWRAHWLDLLTVLFSFKFFKMMNKSIIGMDDSSPALDSIKGSLERKPFVFDQVWDDQRNRTGYSCQTMHHYVGSLETIMDEVGSLVEVLADVTGLVIISRNIEKVRNVMFRVS